MDQEYTHAQSKYSASNAGHGSILRGSVASQIMPDSEIASILKRLDALHSSACILADSVDGLANRLLGSFPECDSNEKEAAGRSGEIGQVNGLIDAVMRALRRAQSAQDRLNRL